MKKEWADKWVAALRSGDYVQGRGTLKQLNRSTDDAVPSFCCLGVLCDLAKDHENIKGHWSGQVFVCGKGTRNVGILPPAVRQETGLSTLYADLIGIEGYQQQSLLRLNDKAGRSFEEIAEIIDKNWQKL